ncbi:protein of unknown function DUF404 [Beutenbergia cavernae DSM 12333]|uniref:Uncharacterized protein n=1 Tax=Beutenbergia cavernae (strain ATCC BAA-8 / DSM 12333 / CCUG 43141 / JCM 11478 / NBRC 16432 / NCIMB 13614 / HKI 0122) TaxID=471853 RepID=C5C4H9_BEUC1|nr:circularly permuted type 2 ATP-grasp protein [Beutenbergia cavernae]ACQ82103.1 protein of unknown function DUF404 [Beutenbergia cavernae DSM 12333]
MTDVLAGYRAGGPGHDEMLQSTGAARAAWAQMADLVGLHHGEQLAQRAADVVALLEDHGVRHGADDAGGTGRPWLLDPLPVLLDEVEWARIESGLRQRALLLDLVLTDLYSGAELLTRGVLPPALILGHRGFVRAVDGIRVPGEHQLFTLAVDLARNADGGWQVLADRAQVPTGMGYAMQDRRIVAEVLSGLYRHARIRRIGPFFQAVRHAAAEVAPAGAGDAPRVALLTPGPDSPAAFDQAYLATMLGYPLVTGEDLVVADGRLWMRSLGRLEPVDVLLRAVDAEHCDPLDLRGDSRLGVAGLVQAARAGAVSVVNPLGSGVLDNPGLLTYLPRLARELLGEELAIGSAVTYWCGERSMCSHVMANLDRLVVRPTAPGAPAVRGWDLTLHERADLAARIADRPFAWVGQEPIEASTTPTVAGSALEARPTTLRAFAVAGTRGYQVMSSGLARVTPEDTVLTDPGPLDAAKDVWVLSSEPYTVADPWVGEAAAPSSTGGTAHLPASISPGAAEDLFWFGRHAEQAEQTVRLVRAVSDRWNDFHASPANVGARALDVLLDAVATVAASGSLSEVVTDARRPGSVAHTEAKLTRTATAVRDQLSGDTWLALSAIERAIARERAHHERDPGSELGPVLARLLEGLLALSGIAAESMVRDAGWSLMDAGRRLERARWLVDTLAATLTRLRSGDVDSLVLESVLIAHESVITYRRRYQARASVGTVLDLLLTDAANPRSLRFQLVALGADLAAVPAPARGTAARDALLADVVDLLDELDTRAAAAAGDDGVRSRLAETLESMRWRLAELGEEIARVHFTHPVPVPWLDASLAWAPDGTAS